MGPSMKPGSGESRLERIARRARELYEARGGEHGRDLDDWLAAEREIDAEMDREAEARARAPLDSDQH
jgi:hypothetical protein